MKNCTKCKVSRPLEQFSKDQDFTGAIVKQIEIYPGEREALVGEAHYIALALQGPESNRCLNKNMPLIPGKLYWVYVIQSQQKRDNGKPGFFYVGMTTEPSRRLLEHNGLYANGLPGRPGGGKYTSKLRPWVGKALHGPYFSRSEALSAEYALKRQKRGVGRLQWAVQDSPLCRGEGVNHPWVQNPLWKSPTLAEWRAGSVVDPT